jgi:hypothetical protein
MDAPFVLDDGVRAQTAPLVSATPPSPAMPSSPATATAGTGTGTEGWDARGPDLLSLRHGGAAAAASFPLHLLPARFTHLRLLFRSKNTLVYRARRQVPTRTGLGTPLLHVPSALAPQSAAAASGAQGEPANVLAYDEVVLKMPNLFAGDGATVPAAAREAAEQVESGAGAKGKVAAGGAGGTTRLSAGAVDSDARAVPLLPFTPLQAARVRHFLQQSPIVQQLQQKNVAGLVSLRQRRANNRSLRKNGHSRKQTPDCARRRRKERRGARQIV